VVYLKPKQSIITDCARRFVLKLYRHEASRGLFATSELLVFFKSVNICQSYAQTFFWLKCTTVQYNTSSSTRSYNRTTPWVIKKLDPFLFHHNFGKYCPILIIIFFHCCRQKLTATKCTLKYTIKPPNLLLHYLVKWTRMYWPTLLAWFRN